MVLTKHDVADVVELHRRDALQSEQELKEAFYRFEHAYFLKYMSEELGGRQDSDRMARSNQYVGYLHAQIETAVARLMATIFAKDPPFEVEPTGGRSMEDAQAIQALHIHSLKMSKFRQRLRQALRYMLIYGTCPMKTVWDERWIRQGRMMPIRLPDGTWDYERVEEDKLIYAGPDSMVVDPYMFHVAPRAESIDDARWVQEEFLRSREYIEELVGRGVYDAPKWDDLDEHVGGRYDYYDYQNRRREVMGVPSQNVTDTGSDAMTSGLYDIVEEWRDDEVITIIGRDRPQVLRRRPLPYAHGRKPYSVFRYIDLANEFWGLSMSRQLEGPQSELNLIRRLRSDAVLSQLQQMWRVSPAAAVHLEDKDFEFRPNGIIEAEKGEIEPLEQQQLPIFGYKEEDILRQDGDLISGITDIVRGQVPASQTATSSTLSANFATDRLALVVDGVSDTLEHMFDLRHKLYQQYADDEQIVKSVGKVQPIAVPIDQILGDYSFIFRSGRSIGQRELHRNQLMQGMTVIAQNPLLAQVSNFTEILRDFWATFDVPNPGRYIIDPMRPGLSQQAELMIMAMGEPVGVSPTDNHLEHIQVIQAFMQEGEFGQIPPEHQELIAKHMQEHMPYAAAQQQAGATPQGLQSPERANVNATAETQGEVLADNNRFIAPNVRTQ